MGSMERNVIFKCPRSGMNVQHWLPDATSGAVDTHVSVRCPACGSLHFVDIASGKMLSEGGGQRRRRHSSDEAPSRTPRQALTPSES
ncbi:putative RNA-binding Zn-ribbon protein involved in translation (DUF1610 family) [Bradyrhizobium sp. USDA 326]|nr:hypothetical protein EHH60_11615 [Bradyrhizobium sp. RP6]